MAPLMGLPGQKTPHGKTLHYEIIHSKLLLASCRRTAGFTAVIAMDGTRGLTGLGCSAVLNRVTVL
jgi:hypothetical protein